MWIIIVFINRALFFISRILNRKEFITFVGRCQITFPLNPKSKGMNKSIVNGGYEADEIHIINKLVKSNDIVLELGAAVGVLATAYGKISKKKHCLVEANGELIPYLERNLHQNNVKNCEILHAMVGLRAKESGEFYVHRDFYSSSSKESADSKIERVPVASIQDLIREVSPTVLIVDIEGGEYDLLDKIDFSGVRLLVVEFHDKGDSATKFIDIYKYIVNFSLVHSFKESRGNVFVFIRES